MAENSLLWTTGGAGDGASTYTRSDWSIIGQIFAACSGSEGVAPSYLNELAGTVTGANTVAINTGGAVVDGKPYHNSSSVNVNIPSASGGGNTRIDRIVLRADWTAQTVRITRIAGTDAASPTAPAITQTSGTTYDIMLYQATVNTSGTVTLTTDERVWALLGVDDSTIENNAGTLRVKDDGITTAKILDANVTTAKITDLNVTAGKIAANAIDDTKAGNRVAQFYRRQGNSATDASQAGDTNYTPATLRVQWGRKQWSGSSATVGSVAVTFPAAFSQIPWIMLQVDISTPGVRGITTWKSSETASGFTLNWAILDGSGAATGIEFEWLAIGAE